MPRMARVAPADVVFHVLNRGNRRARIFDNDEDYRAFLRILAETQQVVPIRLVAYCLMPNHWHLVVWPRASGQLAEYLHRLTTTHVRRWHLHRDTVGAGHLYQGAYKSFPIQKDAHFLTVCRPTLTEWPVPRPDGWVEWVNQPEMPGELDAVRLSVVRGRPYGGTAWQQTVAEVLGLVSTLRPRGRPRKQRLEKPGSPAVL